jgi:hypothetical protein
VLFEADIKFPTARSAGGNFSASNSTRELKGSKTRVSKKIDNFSYLAVYLIRESHAAISLMMEFSAYVNRNLMLIWNRLIVLNGIITVTVISVIELVPQREAAIVNRFRWNTKPKLRYQ